MTVIIILQFEEWLHLRNQLQFLIVTVFGSLICSFCCNNKTVQYKKLYLFILYVANYVSIRVYNYTTFVKYSQIILKNFKVLLYLINLFHSFIQELLVINMYVSVRRNFLVFEKWIYFNISEQGSFTTRQTYVGRCLRRSWSSGGWTPTRWSRAVGLLTASTVTLRSETLLPATHVNKN